MLDVFFRGIYLGQAVAGGYREDLRAHGIGDGRHAFLFHLPDDVPSDGVAADFLVTSTGPLRRILAFSPNFALRRSRGDPVDGGLTQLFGPLLTSVSLASQKLDFTEAAGVRGRLEIMLMDDPVIAASAFIVHIAHKYGQSIDDGDWHRLMQWYLETYASERGPFLAPLSQDDIARLNAEVAPDWTLAMSLSATELEGAEDRLFAWTQACHRRFVEDCLVTETQRTRLRTAHPDFENLAFPLSTFMVQACRRFAVLRRFEPTREQDRRAIYAVLVVLALRRPVILAYLPRQWSRRLLAPLALETVLQDLIGNRVDDACRAIRLLATRSTLLMERPTPNSEHLGSQAAHRILARPAIDPTARAVDVQLIGPFRRRMGLGEAARRVAQAVSRTPYSCNVVDYAVGNASLNIEADLPVGPPRRARLNILQLNLEEVPEAYASLPDVFEATPTVVIPFWELNRPAAAHRLGLRLVDEIWVASHFLESVFAKTGPPVHWIGMSCDETISPSATQCIELRRRLGLKPSTFTFLTTSDALSWVQRKNPLGAVRAFQAAFDRDQDVALIVKTHNLNGPLSSAQRQNWTEIRARCSEDSRTFLVDDSFDAWTQRTLLKAVDCLISLHRGEGLGLDPLDALWLGTPVVTTNYSGVTDVCTSETAWMVDAVAVDVDPSEYIFVEPGHQWASPSHEHAVDCLRRVVTDSEARRHRIEAGRKLVGRVAAQKPFATRLEHAISRWL